MGCQRKVCIKKGKKCFFTRKTNGDFLGTVKELSTLTIWKRLPIIGPIENFSCGRETDGGNVPICSTLAPSDYQLFRYDNLTGGEILFK